MSKKQRESINQIDSKTTGQLFSILAESDYKKLLKPSKLVRLAVSGDVLITETEKDIIDQRDFQRLRKLKQLGSAYLIFPTAIHTRFEHSLGALFMVDKMIKNIRENRHNDEAKGENSITLDEEILARLFALLHDITHIPFGHTIEDEFCIFNRHDEDHSRINRFIGKDSSIGKVIIEQLGPSIHERLIKLLTFNKKLDESLKTLGHDAVVYDLVSNTVCADLLDYLKRDHFYCNLPLGLEYRFLNFLHVYEDPSEETKRVAVRLWKAGQTSARIDILNELVALLEYRYKLAEVVYFHHTKLISGTMLAAAVLRETRINPSFTKESLYEMGDEDLINLLKNSKDRTVRNLAENFDNRKLWKEVSKKTNLDIQKEDANDSTLDYIEKYKKDFYLDSEKRYKIEKQIAESLNLNDGDVLLNCPNPKMQLKYAEMKVFWKGKFRELSKCRGEEIDLIKKKLELILLSHENLFCIRVYVNYELLEKSLNEKEQIIGIKRDVTKAFNHVLSYNTQNEIHNREYPRVIIKRHIERFYDTSRTSHDIIERLESAAVDRYLNPTDHVNDKETDTKLRSLAFVETVIEEEAAKFGVQKTNAKNRS